MEVELITRTTRLKERLAQLREEEHERYQALSATSPYTPDHVAAHGKWTEVRGRIKEIERLLDQERGT